MVAEAGAVNHRQPNPTVSAVLSLFTPGLGHLYAGRPRAFAVLFLAVPVVGFATVAAWYSLPRLFIWLGPVIVLTIWGSVAASAYRRAVRSTGIAKRPLLARWAGYAGVMLAFGVWASAIAGLVRANVAYTFRLSSENMEPTLIPGDHVVVRPISGAEVRLDDVILARTAEDNLTVLSRVVGLGGDTLAMSAGTLIRNGSPVVEPFAGDSGILGGPDPMFGWQERFLVEPNADYSPDLRNWGPIRIPEGRLFVLGDNRSVSFDSRFRGFLDASDIIGRAETVYLSLSDGALQWDRVGLKVDGSAP